MDDLLREFLTESSESLLRLEQEIVELEQRPDDRDLLGSIFRTIHTIKGTCGFLDLMRLEKVAHSAENVLGRLRDGELTVSDDVISDVLAAVDVIKDILEGLEDTEEEPQGDDSTIISRLDAWLGAGDDDARDLAVLDAMFQAARDRAAGELETEGASLPDEAEGADESDDALDEVFAVAAAGAPPAPAVEAEAKVKPAAAKAPGKSPRKDGGEDRRAVADASLRVDVDVLDSLMNLAGELVLTRNQLNQLTQQEEDSSYTSPVQQLNRVTTDLQEAVMKTRMQPVGNAWGKLPRVVRDLAAASGKQINLHMIGQETELDRQILQAIRDPLTHMVRNSADHGIEDPDVRVAAGKDPQGQIALEAFHEGGHIVIEIRDDGKGLPVDAIRQKAVDRGLLDQDAAAALPDHRVFDYIFEAGFSTATKVTNVSGRGVGMDVVRRNIEKIGGTTEVTSTAGEGSTFRIKIPLTLAIMSALIVGVCDQAFAIPQIGVLELVRVGEDNAHLVEHVSGSHFYRLRDELLPLVRLSDVLGLDDGSRFDGTGSIVVCQVGALRFGLVVTTILDTHEIVVKPVGRMVKGIRQYAGNTILGDGSVIMILDVAGIALEENLQARTKSVEDAAENNAHDAKAYAGQGTSMLLFTAGAEAPKAVPLAMVSRLEEFAADTIERADGRWVVQYRGKLLPVVAADADMEMLAVDPRPVVVISDGDTPIGLAVDAISDIVQEELKVEVQSETPGILGTAVISGRTTELLDIDHHVAQAHQRWDHGLSGDEGARLLLVDDSPFFLNLLTPLLRAEGYRVSVSHDGQHALTRLHRGERFDLIVSDIDMPQIDGFQLARHVRADGRWRDMPLLALTSRDSDQDRAAGVEAGFDKYMKKFDQESVLEAVRDVLHSTRELEESLV